MAVHGFEERNNESVISFLFLKSCVKVKEYWW